MMPFASFWPNITFQRVEGRTFGSPYIPFLDGKEMPGIAKNSRWVYDGGWFVLKIEQDGWGYKQNLVESTMWDQIQPQDRMFFARVLGFGVLDEEKRITFELQEKIEVDGYIRHDNVFDKMTKLFNKYDLRDLAAGQGKLVVGEPFFKIHDYGITDLGDDSPMWNKAHPSWFIQATRFGRKDGSPFREAV